MASFFLPPCFGNFTVDSFMGVFLFPSVSINAFQWLIWKDYVKKEINIGDLPNSKILKFYRCSFHFPSCQINAFCFWFCQDTEWPQGTHSFHVMSTLIMIWKTWRYIYIFFLWILPSISCKEMGRNNIQVSTSCQV